MNIVQEERGSQTILVINSQSLAGDDATELKAKAVELIDLGLKDIALDLSTPEYIDSSGIGKLLFINKKMEKLERKFSIIKINKKLFDFLDSLAIPKVIDIAEPFN